MEGNYIAIISELPKLDGLNDEEKSEYTILNPLPLISHF
jgi:hypothetical protein